jgi:hypothetical protein
MVCERNNLYWSALKFKKKPCFIIVAQNQRYISEIAAKV